MEELKVSEFDRFFEIMENSFPKDERRPYGEQRALLRNPDHRVFVSKEGGRIVSFLATWRFGEVFFLEHFATDPALRGGGIGGRLLDEWIAECRGTVLLEAEPPTDEVTRRRIAFYERHGFVLNPYPYVQPPISEGRSPVPLMIMTHGRAVSEAEYAAMRDLLYHRVYRCIP